MGRLKLITRQSTYSFLLNYNYHLFTALFFRPQKLIMNKLIIGCTALSMLFISCDEDENTSNNEHPHVNFTMNHKVGSEELLFDSMKYTNTSGHEYEVQTLKYFVSNVQLHNTNGDTLTFAGPFYIDAEKSTTFSFNGHTEIASGTYSKISIDFGLDTTLNVSKTLNSAEEISMEWPEMMGGGYHYMKFEGRYDSSKTGTIKSFAMHTGGTMGNDYHVSIDVPNSGFTATNDEIDITFHLDLNEWFTDPNEYDLADYGMIMGNMNAQMLLKANGQSVISVSIK